MANFFKEYQQKLRQQKLNEIRIETEKQAKLQAQKDYAETLKEGKKIKFYDNSGQIAYGYFVGRFNDEVIWCNDNKNGSGGYTLHVECLII